MNHFSQFPLQCCMVEYLACIKGDLQSTVVASSLCVQCEQGDKPGCPPTIEILHGCDGITTT